jgi:K+-transporting ATPase KdpF subunit
MNSEHRKEDLPYEPDNLVSGNVSLGPGIHGPLFPVLESVRENLRNEVMPMIYLTAAVAAFLVVYLCVALIRPEWF